MTDPGDVTEADLARAIAAQCSRSPGWALPAAAADAGHAFELLVRAGVPPRDALDALESGQLHRIAEGAGITTLRPAAKAIVAVLGELALLLPDEQSTEGATDV